MDGRDNKDWLQIWYKETGENVRWNKDQSWKAVQWTLALFAVIGVAAKTYHGFPRGLWCFFVVLVLGATIGWLLELHRAAGRERSIGEGLVASLPERKTYLPELEKSEKWDWILLGKIVVLGVAAFVIGWEIWS